MRGKTAFGLLVLSLLFTLVSPLPAQTTAPSDATPIDIAHSPAPLFDDPIWHGASDPFVIWNPVKSQWFMYYTQRRATLQNPHGVDWVHGSAIGIATSSDGAHWSYLGTCKGDHDLSDPLAAKGAGPEPGVTWWAPCFLQQGNVMHMWVVLVDGVYTNWTGKRNILHFTSDDGVNWKYVSTAQLSSNRVIDPTVYRIGDEWYIVYKDEANGSATYLSQSTDLDNWTNARKVSPDGHQEAPFVFQWKGQWWLMVDALGDKGLRIYKSANGVDGWKYVATILDKPDGTRPGDDGVGHHPGIVIQGTGDSQQCLVFYFTQHRNQTIMQLAELEVDANGKPFCNRNKYASPQTSQSRQP
jgi:hypothetical protein